MKAKFNSKERRKGEGQVARIVRCQSYPVVELNVYRLNIDSCGNMPSLPPMSMEATCSALFFSFLSVTVILSS